MALTHRLLETMQRMTLVSLSPDNSVHFAYRIMGEYRADVALLKRRGCVVGMVTLHSLNRRIAEHGRDSENTTLAAIMTPTPEALAVR